MTQGALDEIAKKGICSIESIEYFKRMAGELEVEENVQKILEAERVLKAISDRTRLKLLLLLSKGEMCVCQIAAVSEMKQPAISSSLRLMEKAGLLRREQRGKWHFYHLAENDAIPLILRLVQGRV